MKERRERATEPRMRFWDPEVAQNQPYSSVILAAYLDRNEDFPQSYLCTPLYLLSAQLASGRPWEKFNSVALDLRAAQARTGIVHREMGVRAKAEDVRKVLEQNWLLEKNYSSQAAQWIIKKDFSDTRVPLYPSQDDDVPIVDMQQFLDGPGGASFRGKILTTAELFFNQIRDPDVQQQMGKHKLLKIASRKPGTSDADRVLANREEYHLGMMLVDRLKLSDTRLSVTSLHALLLPQSKKQIV